MPIMEIEVPEWAYEKHNLFLMQGIEVVAVKRPGSPWVVKESRCSNCGACCMHKHLQGVKKLPKKDGKCIFLSDHPTEEGKVFCSWEYARPFICCIGEPKFEPSCTISWRYMEGVDSDETRPLKGQDPDALAAGQLESLADATGEDEDTTMEKVVSQSD